MKTTAFGHLGWERPFVGYLCTVGRTENGLFVYADFPDTGRSLGRLANGEMVLVLNVTEDPPFVQVISQLGIGWVNNRWLFVVSRGT